MTKTMEYNSEKENLIISEYGRNVQNLIKYAKTIEDPELRQKFIERIVNLMHQMNPQNKNVPEYRNKLWAHVFRIADFELDVKAPEGVKLPDPDFKLKPDIISYPKNNSKFRHYGQNVGLLVEKALAMEKGPERETFINIIGSYMKLAYRTWNREHYVSDEIIKEDLKSMSNGEIALDESVSLDYLASSMRRMPQRRSNHSNRNNKKRNYGGSNNHRRRR